MGHADYYPNGGRTQPGCGVDVAGSCAHSRAYAYYAESLNSDKFVATKCDSFNSFTKGSCKTNPTSSMGMFMVDTKYDMFENIQNNVWITEKLDDKWVIAKKDFIWEFKLVILVIRIRSGWYFFSIKSIIATFSYCGGYF